MLMLSFIMPFLPYFIGKLIELSKIRVVFGGNYNLKKFILLDRVLKVAKILGKIIADFTWKNIKNDKMILELEHFS